jgi:hypothetical protein
VSARHYVSRLHAAAASTSQTVLVALVESCIDDLQQVIPAA